MVQNGAYMTIWSQFVQQMLVRVHPLCYVEASFVCNGFDKNEPRSTVLTFDCHETDFENYTSE